MKPVEAQARHRAREAALQMLYQSEVGRLSPGDTVVITVERDGEELELEVTLGTLGSGNPTTTIEN